MARPMRFWGHLGAAAALAAGVPLAAPLTAAAQAPASIRGIDGTVAVVGGTVDVQAIEARINGQPVPIARDGSLTASLPDAADYRISLRGPAIFDADFAFAAAELGTKDGKRVLPQLEVVARAPGRVEFFFGGDVMMARRYEKPIWGERTLIHPATRAADMARLLAPMRPYFAGADLASVNLETVLAAEDLGDAPDKTVVFYTHRDAAQVFADAGIDYVTLGNNHVYDYVEPGLASTLAALDKAKLPWSGAGRNEAEALKAARINVGGQPYAMLGFVGWKGRVEPNQVAESAKGGAAFGSDENIETAVTREVAAGRMPIVQYHGSSEYSDRPTDISERRMKLAIDKGAVLVVSHHPHVSHGLELYKGRLIAYSLGNFVFDQYFPETQATYALKVWMDGGTLFRAEILPIQLLDYRPVPATGAIRQAALHRIIDLSAERGTRIALSGGHGVITPQRQPAPPRECAATSISGVIAYRYALDPAAPCAAATAAMAGRDLILRGDFEAARYDDATDRSWASENGSIDFVASGFGGGHALALRPDAAASSATVAPTTFFRNGNARRYTLVGRARSDSAATLAAFVQLQPKGSGMTKAIESAPRQPIGTAALTGGAWTDFRFDVELAAGDEELPLRPLLQVDGKPVRIDDIAFVAWDEPANGEPPAPGRSYSR